MLTCVVTIGRQGLHADFCSESLAALGEVSIRDGYHVPSGLLNDIYLWGGFTPELLKFLQWEKPVRIPKPYDDWPDKPYYIPHMQMSRELYQKIDWEAKLDEGSRTSTR